MEHDRTTSTTRPGERPCRPRRFRPGLAAVLAALVLVPTLALAGGPRSGGPFGGRDGGLLGGGPGPGFFAGAAEGEAGEGLHRRLPLRRLAIFLDLTEAQITEGQAIVDAARAEAEPLRAETRDLALALREALDAAEPDAAAVGALVVDLDANRDALRAIFDGAVEEFEAILTPEQIERFEILREAIETFFRGLGRGPDPGGPPADAS